jgi:hypothetical protein
MSVWADEGSQTSGWNRLEKDFAGGYGEIGKNKNSETFSNTYNRIVRAWFLKYHKNIPPEPKKDAAEPKKDAPPVAAPVIAPAPAPAAPAAK